MIVGVQVHEHDPRGVAGGVVEARDAVPQEGLAVLAVHGGEGGARVADEPADDGLVESAFYGGGNGGPGRHFRASANEASRAAFSGRVLGMAISASDRSPSISFRTSRLDPAGST